MDTFLAICTYTRRDTPCPHGPRAAHSQVLRPHIGSRDGTGGSDASVITSDSGGASRDTLLFGIKMCRGINESANAVCVAILSMDHHRRVYASAAARRSNLCIG